MPKFRVAVTAYAEFEVSARDKKRAETIASARAMHELKQQERLSIRVERKTDGPPCAIEDGVEEANWGDL